MKIAFLVSGEGSDFESIRNGSMAKEFLKDYNIEYVDCGDYLRIATDQIAYVNDIDSFNDVKYFCQKYCCELIFNGGRPQISFRTVPEDEIPLYNVWDLKEHSASKLRSMYAQHSKQANGINGQMNPEDEAVLEIFEAAIYYVSGLK